MSCTKFPKGNFFYVRWTYLFTTFQTCSLAFSSTPYVLSTKRRYQCSMNILRWFNNNYNCWNNVDRTNKSVCVASFTFNTIIYILCLSTFYLRSAGEKINLSSDSLWFVHITIDDCQDKSRSVFKQLIAIRNLWICKWKCALKTVVSVEEIYLYVW